MEIYTGEGVEKYWKLKIQLKCEKLKNWQTNRMKDYNEIESCLGNGRVWKDIEN